MAKKNKSRSAANLISTALIAVAALVFFAYRSGSREQTPDKQPRPDMAKPEAPAIANRTAVGTSTLTAEQKRNLGIPENLPEDMVRALTSPPPELPPDLKAQLEAAPPELPPDLKAQLAAPPPELPADLKAQLEARPPELPEDIKKSLASPPRVVSIEEVNGPGNK